MIPANLCAMLPREWSLARMSVSAACKCDSSSHAAKTPGRVELSGFAFTELPREVSFLHGYGRYVCREAQVTESNSDRGYVR